jgi:hypothetical protein
MVADKRLAGLGVLLAVLGILFLAFMPLTRAQDITYSVNQEWTKVWINTDSSVNVLYNITLTYLTGLPQGLLDVGMSKGGFQVNYVEDLSGSSLQYNDISGGSYYAIEVSLKKPIVLNQPITAIVYATVPGMINPDSTNPGNDGVQFFPSTFPSASGSIADLRVEIVLPPGVQTSEVKYPTGLPFDNVFVDENRTAVYWNRTDWSPSQQFESGVSFPEQYVVVQPPGFGAILPVVIAVIVILLIVVAFVVARAKAAYVNPRISIEALGANRSLTAVEAGLVMGLKPVRVLK